MKRDTTETAPKWLSEVEANRRLLNEKSIDKLVLAKSELQLMAAEAELKLAKLKLELFQSTHPKLYASAIDRAKAALDRAEDECKRWKNGVEVDRRSVEKGVLDNQTLWEAEYRLKAAEADRDLAKAKLDFSLRPPPMQYPRQLDIAEAQAALLRAEAEYWFRKRVVDRWRAIKIPIQERDKPWVEQYEKLLEVADAARKAALSKLELLQTEPDAVKRP